MKASHDQEPTLYTPSREDIVDIYGQKNDLSDYGQQSDLTALPLVEVEEVKAMEAVVQPTLFDAVGHTVEPVAEQKITRPPKAKRTSPATYKAREWQHTLEARKLRWGR